MSLNLRVRGPERVLTLPENATYEQLLSSVAEAFNIPVNEFVIMTGHPQRPVVIDDDTEVKSFLNLNETINIRLKEMSQPLSDMGHEVEGYTTLVLNNNTDVSDLRSLDDTRKIRYI